MLGRLMQPLLRSAYSAFDHVVDIGPFMRARIGEYDTSARTQTITPWALAEAETLRMSPADSLGSERRSLTVLYSGNLGAAHGYAAFLELARRMRAGSEPRAQFYFAVDGSRVGELRRALRPDDENVRIVSLRDESSLREALESADLHMVSLRPDWSGVVVPSKFFAALAVGRPVLYYGARTSDIAHWIEEYQVGFVLTDQNIDRVRKALMDLAGNPRALHAMQRRSHEVYHRVFSKSRRLAEWMRLLADSRHPGRNAEEFSS